MKLGKKIYRRFLGLNDISGFKMPFELNKETFVQIMTAVIPSLSPEKIEEIQKDCDKIKEQLSKNFQFIIKGLLAAIIYFNLLAYFGWLMLIICIFCFLFFGFAMYFFSVFLSFMPTVLGKYSLEIKEFVQQHRQLEVDQPALVDQAGDYNNNMQ